MTPEEIDQLAEAIASKLHEKNQPPKPLEEGNFDHWDKPSSFTPPANSKLAQEKDNDGIEYQAKGTGRS